MHQMQIMAPDGTAEIQQVEQNSESETESSVKGKEITARKGITKPPLNSLAILNEAGQSIDTSSLAKLCEQLYAGVFLKPNRLKYFVDKKSNKNGFMLFARELEIEWAENPLHWKWNQDEDASGEDIEVAELIKVSWLDLKGYFWTIDLSLGTRYEIVFVVKIIGGNISRFSVNLNIYCPNFEFEERHESLEGKPLQKWVQIQVGEFIMSPEMVGHLKFRLHATDQLWKHGLVVKCAIIRPKN